MRAAKPYNQPSLFDQPAIVFDMVAGKKLGESGLSLALETAEKKEKGWTKLCWQLFLVWLRRNVKRGQEFKIEQFRKHLNEYGLIDRPPSERAYGFLSKKGVKEGWIGFAGTGKCENTKAHATPVNVWYKK